MKQKGDSFLWQCRQNYFDGIFPADTTIIHTEGYQFLKELAQSYFDSNSYDDFEGYLMEGHYLVQLWAAHLILEYGNPSEELKQKCLSEIKKYAENVLNSKLAAQETAWLKNYYDQ